MTEITLTADELVQRLLATDAAAQLCLLDSCGRTLGASRFLIAGIYPVEKFEFSPQNKSAAVAALRFLDEKLANYQTNDSQMFGGGFCAVTLNYEFGMRLENLTPRRLSDEPGATFYFYETFFVHDYQTRQTFVIGKNEREFADHIKSQRAIATDFSGGAAEIAANFTESEYRAAVERIRAHIVAGDIYQANLTQQFQVRLNAQQTPERIFQSLRTNHAAPFAAFVRRENDAVVSISPERFFKVESSREIIAAPIKGTRRRGANASEDEKLRSELLASDKDRAENVMIVDLLRNDLGRVCEFGSVRVEKLCELETHETLFHLVSTIRGTLRANVKMGDLIAATFPCGSITGAPKIRAMQILDDIETAPRNLSMGAIGYFGFDGTADLNVAIRTMTIRENKAVFNVGGGIVFDSDPAAEYAESLLKARALLAAFDKK